MFELKPQNELLQLLNAGASFRIKAHLKPQNERLQLANAVKAGGGQLKLLGLNLLPQNELLQLANAGKGHIFFED